MPATNNLDKQLHAALSMLLLLLIMLLLLLLLLSLTLPQADTRCKAPERPAPTTTYSHQKPLDALYP
jgi:hypothetical protein